MKTLLLTLLALLSVPAFAETITLGPDNCGIIVQCLNIPNDAALDIDLFAYPTYDHATLYLDGVQYTGSNTIPLYDSVPFSSDDGTTVLLSATFTTYRTCVRSGRGQHCSTHYQLTGGTITR